MNIFQLECFLAVAAHLNFAKAAEQMNITQPAITHQIQSLEKELSVKLFLRSTRFVELTFEGTVFLSDAKHIVMISRAAVNRFLSSDPEEIVTLSIGCYSFSGLLQYTDAFRRLSGKYKNVHPKISFFSDSQLLKRLEDGHIDVALKTKIDAKANNLHYRELGKVRPLCVMDKRHPLAGSDAVSIDDLKEEKLVLYTPDLAGPPKLQKELLSGKKPSQLCFCESVETSLLLTGAGYGISILPENFYLTRELDMKAVPLADAEPLSFGLYYKSLHEKPYLKDFIDYMLQTALS